MLVQIDSFLSAQHILRSLRSNPKFSLLQRCSRIVLTLVVIGACTLATKANAGAEGADFFCGTDQHGVFRATMGKMVCPGGATTDIQVSDKRVFCMYTAVCLPSSKELKQAVVQINAGQKFETLTDDDINDGIVKSVSMGAFRPNSQPIQASIQCISDDEGGCPKVNECLKMKNGGTFGWGYSQHGGTQGFSGSKNGQRVPTTNINSNR